MTRSLAERFADLDPFTRDALMATLSPDEAAALTNHWPFIARPEQRLPDGDYSMVAWITGRSYGKTRSASSAFNERVKALGGRVRGQRGLGRGAVVHRTATDVREVCVEGPDGLLATAPKGWRPKYEPSKKRITWPNGFVANTYSADEPDQLRGPTLSLSWAEEFATWKGQKDESGATAWDNLRYAMRGRDPLTLVTTTPKRVKSLRELEARAAIPGSGVIIVRGTLYENRRNIPESFIAELVEKFGGSALGLQEIEGLLAGDVEGASFKQVWFEEQRIAYDDLPELSDVYVCVDPSVGDGTADECGIAVVALSAGKLHDGRRHLYVLDDCTVSGPPDLWASEVNETCEDYGTHLVLVENNQGGQMAQSILKNVNPALRVREVHAKTSKKNRADAASLVFATGQAHMVDEMPELEAQCTTWTPTDRYSPDRMDAMVHGVNHLMPKLGVRPSDQQQYSVEAMKKQVK